MEARQPPYHAHFPAQSPPQTYHDAGRHSLPQSPYRQDRIEPPRYVPAGPGPPPPQSIPPPPPPPGHPTQPERFFHQRRSTLETAPAPVPPPHPRADHRPSLSYPPPPYIPQQEYHRNDGYGRPGSVAEARDGYGTKRTHEQAMNGHAHGHNRKDSRPHQALQAPATPQQHHPPPPSHPQPPPPLPPHPPSYPYQPPGVVSHPAHVPVQHAPEHQRIGNGSMYHSESGPLPRRAPSSVALFGARATNFPARVADLTKAPTSRSPPPPSPYSNRPMLPPGPGSPPYASPSYGPPLPPPPPSQQQQHGPLPPPPFAREPAMAGHRPGSGMSISSMLDNGPSRPPPDQRHHHSNGLQTNGHTHFGEREGPRIHAYSQHENRSLTPDAYHSRHHDYTRPSRAYSGGDAHGRPMLSPEKMAFGPPLPTHHEGFPDSRLGGLPPHNSAPQSRRASITAGGPSLSDRPSTGHIPGQYIPHGPSVDHIGVPRPPPPPLHGPPDQDLRMGPVYGPPNRPIWSEHEQRPPQYRDDPQKTVERPFFAPQNQYQHQPSQPQPYGPAPPPLVDLPRGLGNHQAQTNGNAHHPDILPVYGPAPDPSTSASAPPPAIDQGPRLPVVGENRKLSVEALYQGRIESPLQRHRHIMMDRTNSTGSGRLSIGPDKRRAASPLPQAVQGAQAQPKGPASEPGIKGEFGRMFSGLGGVTPTPTPVELATKRYASPAAERDLEMERRASGTPMLGDKIGRSGGAGSKRNRKARDDDGMSSPTLELARTLSGRGVKRSRNSYIGVDSTSPVLGRNDPGVPWAAGTARQRSFTPTSFAALSASKRAAQTERERERAAERERERDERKPVTVVSSKIVLDSVRNKTRKHLGSMLYDVKISPENLQAGEEGSRFGYDSKPEILPRFEEKDNCTFTVRVDRRFLTPKYREEVIDRRNLWGSEVYTDDSDVLAAAIHSGWIRGEWGPNVDTSVLGLNGKQNDQHEFRPNGRSSLSVSVSPELSRKSLANGKASTNGTPSASPSKDSGRTVADPDDALTAPPRTGPVLPPSNRDAHITVLLLPRLQSYASTVNCGIKSRAWGKGTKTSAHDGVSFIIHKIEWVDEGPASRKIERGAGARHRRIAQGIRDRMGGGSTNGFNLGDEMAKVASKPSAVSNGVGPSGKTVTVGA